MDTTVTGRHVQISQRFRDRLDERMAKIGTLAPKVHRVDVVVTHLRQARMSECVEVTCHGRGPVIRAEATADDKYVALDAAFDKLTERLRRAADRRRVNRGKRGVEPVAAEVGAPPEAEVAAEEGSEAPFGDSPIDVREKVHASAPMSLTDALNEMELVGHDFYLFHDKDTNKPSVLYRRRGWSYGVIHLDLHEEQPNG